jgi:hypothetical protein
MWGNTELRADYARQQYREFVANAEHDRLVASFGRPLAVSRLVARPIGHMLFHLGSWLLRYGRSEPATMLATYRPSARSVKLN